MSGFEVKMNPAVGSVGSHIDREQGGRLKDSGGPGFGETLKSQMDSLAQANPVVGKALPSVLKFSNHAVERMSQRGIHFTPDQMTRIEGAARMAAEKGAKETLIFTDDSALIVSVKNNTVVTVMDKNALKENVFTNIDSTVMV